MALFFLAENATGESVEGGDGAFCGARAGGDEAVDSGDVDDVCPYV